MLKFLNSKILGSAVFAVSLMVETGGAFAGDVDAGAKVFKKCKSCHAVGEGAKNKTGPELNKLMGRKVGSVEGQKYSKGMIKAGEEGMVWDEKSLNEFLSKPKAMFKDMKMAFSGLKKEDDRANVIAYLATFSESATEENMASKGSSEAKAEIAKTETADTPSVATASAEPVKGETSTGKFGLGRLATKEEVAAWDIDIRPDGMGLPVGKGSVMDGEPIYADNCASCHGDFGEAVGRWPVLAGGQGTLQDERPVKTIGSYWPHLSTVYDYVRRAMPFGDARSLTDDDVYSLTAYLLYLNDIVDDDFVLSSDNFKDIKMPNVDNFIPDDRVKEPEYAQKKEPCMKECKIGKVKITMHARVLDVTPEGGDGEEASGAGIE